MQELDWTGRGPRQSSIVAAINGAVLGKWESLSVNFDFGIPEEGETMVARMLFVSQLTLFHSIFGTPSAKISIYAKLG